MFDNCRCSCRDFLEELLTNTRACYKLYVSRPPRSFFGTAKFVKRQRSFKDLARAELFHRHLCCGRAAAEQEDKMI